MNIIVIPCVFLQAFASLPLQVIPPAYFSLDSFSYFLGQVYYNVRAIKCLNSLINPILGPIMVPKQP